ncbi:MAG: Rne/Rng family ribonuclease [Actinomycetota bacterium]
MTDHETEAPAQSAPTAEHPTTEADERLAAFKRGAPIPKAKAAPATAGTRAPSRVPAEPKAVALATAPTTEARAATTEAPARPTTVKPRPDETEPTAPQAEGDAPARDGAAPKSGARRRRGGRGRGGGGQRPAASVEPGDVADPADVATETDRPARAPRAPRGEVDADTTSGTTTSDAAGEESADGTLTAPRKRRRRGGRGRGGRTGGLSGATTGETSDTGADDEADVRETAATQRDDATPDAPTTGTGSRRRGSRGTGAGSGNGGRATPEKPSTDKEAVAKGDNGNGRAKAKPMSVEEQVAAGGPTRNIRNTRSRTGRSGGREGGRGRRREPVIVPPRITDKLMVITEHGERDQIAVLEENVLVQHYVTRTGATSMVGNVYLGRVQNVLPGMEAAFVDVGRGRNGVLYAGEVNYRPEDLEGPAPRIEQVLKSGQAVLVQVTKDPMGGKGARLTAQISLPGRFLVFAPNQSLSGISRRLGDNERKRLKTIMRTIKPEEHGVIVRTAAEGASEEALTHDLARLVRQWDEIQRQAKKVKAPAVVYEEPELTVRVVRDLFTDEEYRELVTDSRNIYDKIMAYVGDIAPDLAPKIKLHEGKLPAFEEHRIEEQIHKALDRKVWLPSGGYLIIERTEAMTIVDVNTGKSVGKTNLEETVVNTNLEAAQEVARQLRLRDIGGIIVVDFIDMLLEKNKSQVEDTMKEAMALDKTRSQVFEIGPLGLMQVTRKRVSSGLVESFSETCPTCEGRGILLNYGS